MFEYYHYAHAVAVALVVDVRYALYLLVVDKLGYLLYHLRLVYRMYGISVTMMLSRPEWVCSISVLERMTTRPRPVS